MVVQIGGGGRAALALLRPPPELRRLIEPQPLLIDAVEIVIGLEAARDPGLDEGLVDRPRPVGIGHLQRTARAMQGGGAALIVLGFEEVRQHVGKGPAGAAVGGPAIVVRGMAAHIKHGVDQAGTAQTPAPRLIGAPAVELGLRLAFEAPVGRAQPARHDGGCARGHAQQEIPAGAARLDQANLDIGVFTQPCGQHRARRTAADDHVIEHVSRPSQSLPAGIPPPS